MGTPMHMAVNLLMCLKFTGVKVLPSVRRIERNLYILLHYVKNVSEKHFTEV